MVDDLALDPVAVISEILAGGPVPAPEFRKLCHDRGIPVKRIPAATKGAGAVCHRVGKFGQAGPGWVWELIQPPRRFMKRHPGRKGWYADSLYRHGKEIQCKLGDDEATARKRLAEILADLKAKRADDTPSRGQCRKPTAKPIHVQLRDIARECRARAQSDIARRLLKLCGHVARLEI